MTLGDLDPSQARNDRAARSHAFVAGGTRGSLALARALLREGLRVTLADVPVADAALRPLVDEVAAAGASFGGLSSVRDVDVVFVEGYSGPAAWSALIDEARRRGAAISTLADYVFSRAQAVTLGVTGTAGKSTVTALAIHLLQAAGITVHAVTDLGPESQLGPNYELVDAVDGIHSGVLVAELAGQRLAAMHTSPNIAVVTSIFPDHFEDFGSFEAYVDAKRTIVRHQDATGWAILPGDDEAFECFAPWCAGRVATFGTVDRGRDAAVFVRDGRVVGRLEGAESDLGEAPADQVALQNALAGCAAALAAGAGPEAVGASLPQFGGARFRRQLVLEHRGVRVVNDALATTPDKARAGLETMDRPVVWIAGGRAKYGSDMFEAADPALADLEALAAVALERVRSAYVFGPAGAALLEPLRSVGVDAVAVPDLEAAVTAAASTADAGDVILLGPAMYNPPEDRARFDELVVDALRVRSEPLRTSPPVRTTENGSSEAAGSTTGSSRPDDPAECIIGHRDRLPSIDGRRSSPCAMGEDGRHGTHPSS